MSLTVLVVRLESQEGVWPVGAKPLLIIACTPRSTSSTTGRALPRGRRQSSRPRPRKGYAQILYWPGRSSNGDASRCVVGLDAAAATLCRPRSEKTGTYIFISYNIYIYTGAFHKSCNQHPFVELFYTANRYNFEFSILFLFLLSTKAYCFHDV